MQLRVSKSNLSGALSVPPSKSHTLRGILFGAMAKGKTKIYNYLKSWDTYSMIDAVTKLGAKVRIRDDFLEIAGNEGNLHQDEIFIDAGNSGQILRFVSALAALSSTTTKMTGDHSICHNRPIKPLTEALEKRGAKVKYLRTEDHPPFLIKGPLQPGTFHLNGEDSQPVSALLIASAFLKGDSEIFVENPGEKPWIDVTLSWLSKFGVSVENTRYTHYKVKGNVTIQGFDHSIPGDFSSAAFPIAAALITGSELMLNHLPMQDPQGDKMLIDVFIKMGAQIELDEKNHSLSVKKSGPLKGIKVDINDFVDGITILAVVACYATSPTEIYNGKITRFKECDRISAIAQELRKMGAQMEEKEDGLIIFPSPLKGAQVYSHKDHRVAMSLAVAALNAEGDTVIDDVACIKKSYPTFAEDFKAIGAEIYLS